MWRARSEIEACFVKGVECGFAHIGFGVGFYGEGKSALTTRLPYLWGDVNREDDLSLKPGLVTDDFEDCHMRDAKFLTEGFQRDCSSLA